MKVFQKEMKLFVTLGECEYLSTSLQRIRQKIDWFNIFPVKRQNKEKLGFVQFCIFLALNIYFFIFSQKYSNMYFDEKNEGSMGDYIFSDFIYTLTIMKKIETKISKMKYRFTHLLNI